MPYCHDSILLSDYSYRYTKDHSMESDRAALLVLHTFCLRLQGEVDTFIRQFVGRHLSLRAVFKKPDHFQVTSPLVDINPVGFHFFT